MPRWLALCLVVALGTSAKPVTPCAAQPDSTFTASMQAGDTAYRAFDNVSALTSYGHALAVDSTAFAAMWKLSRAYVDCGAAATGDRRPELLAAGERVARRCVGLYPDSAQAHFALALALGRAADHAGGKRKIALSKEIRHEAQSALDLNPNHAGALHILGRWHYQLSGVNWFERSVAKVIYGGVPPGATIEQARENFERAGEIDPDVPLNHYWLGETLIKLHEYDRARVELQVCINQPDRFWDDAITKEKARKRLKDIEGKK